MRTMLLAVTGLSPAVVTETLYAINKQKLAWPDSIRIITTQRGKDIAISSGLAGQIAALCAQCEQPQPSFSDDHIRVVPGANGNPVEDARSLADHEALADFITQEVRDIATDANVNIHASIAGGRKTMTFYLGYAMSLFGRHQDCLSHVLVSEEFEGVPGFFFPTRDDTVLENSRLKRTVHPKDAEVVLADIPFIRMREELPEKELSRLGTQLSFRNLMALFDLGNRPHDIHLCLPADRAEVQIVDRANGHKETLKIGPLEYAFFRMLARVTRDGEATVRRPGEEHDSDLSRLFVDELLRLEGFDVGEYDTLANTDAIDMLSNLDERRFPVQDRTIRALESGMRTTWFDSRCIRINDILHEHLPKNLRRWLEPRQVFDENGIRYEISEKMLETAGKKGAYGLAISPKQIELK